ncbi:hypothetical protein CE91St1_00590 [Parabacteroides goldsteinii]|nr:hypothetical protein CE91St1_00590 [Parabacteroides goldsteinii]GKG76867.1 hypothetical protein CE91St2_00590 [Parabacteroides goldsteinii]
MCYIWKTFKTKANMIEKLDYAMVPTGFAHCFNGNCKSADHCLRHQIVRFIPDTHWSISVVNPACTNSDGDCKAFMADTPVQYAVGMDHLLDRIPYKEAKCIKQRLLMTYGKNKFYQFKRKERIFSPEDQHYIQQVFLNNGVEEEPTFDSWKTGYRWTKG